MFSRDVAALPLTKKLALSQINDAEFGLVLCRRSPQSRYVRVRVMEDGTVRASLPKRAPLYLVSELLDNSRLEIRKLVATQRKKRVVYTDGMRIGHSHKLSITHKAVDAPHKTVRHQVITIDLPMDCSVDTDIAQQFISKHVKQVLRNEATSYLPRRLRYLADMFGFHYEKERFGNQRGRWGSCSSSGTISLNVALMNLPHDLIDYVLIHELAHTRHMNHSEAFWQQVKDCLPEYQQQRKILKTMSPIC